MNSWTSLRALAATVSLGATLVISLGGCAATDATADQTEARWLAARASGLGQPTGPPRRGDKPRTWDGRTELSEDLAAGLALAANPALQAELETVALARADRAEAGLVPNPILSAALGAASDGGFAQPLSLRLMFPLMWLWQRPDRVAAAEAGLRATILSAADRASRIVIGARGDHVRARMAELAVEQAEALVMARQDQLRLATSLLEAGLTTRAAHARAALAAGDARNGLAKRRAEAEAARRNLLKRIGRAEGEATFVLGAAMPAPADRVSPGEAELARLTLEQRLDVAAARAAVKSAQARLELADFARWPGLSAAIGYDKNFQGAEAMMVGAQITPPLFDQGSVTIARAEASERLQAARALAVSQEAVRETRVAYRWYLAARERHERFRGTMLPAAEDDRKQADAELEAGTLDATAAFAARARAIARRIEAYDLDLARALARLELERAIGGPLPHGALPDGDGEARP